MVMVLNERVNGMQDLTNGDVFEEVCLNLLDLTEDPIMSCRPYEKRGGGELTSLPDLPEEPREERERKWNGG